MELSLVFDAVEETDMGNYTCNVENHIGRGSGSAILQKKGEALRSCAVFLVFLGSVVEHCVSSAKGCGFDSQGTHILMKMYNLNVLYVALDKSVC